MTTPADPFGPAAGEPTPPVQGYGPPASDPPAYGQPAYGQPAYGAPASGAWQGPELASWGSRVGAALIDAIPVLVIEFLFIGIGAAIGGATGGLLSVIGYLGAIGFAFWNLAEQGKTGQTIGKKVLGLKCLKEQDGQVLGVGLSIGRAFTHIVDGIPCYVGFLWPLWDAKKQTFADKILKTVVVKA